MADFYCDEVFSGHTPVEVVIETATVLAFQHTRPHYATHVVVVPKQHVGSLLDLAASDPLLDELIAVVQQVGQIVINERGGAHIVTNLGKFQDSGHLHFHVGAD